MSDLNNKIDTSYACALAESIRIHALGDNYNIDRPNAVFEMIEAYGGKVYCVLTGDKALTKNQSSYYPASIHIKDKNDFKIFLMRGEPVEINQWMAAQVFSYYHLYYLHNEIKGKESFFMSGGGNDNDKIVAKNCTGYALGLLLPEEELRYKVKKFSEELNVSKDALENVKEYNRKLLYRKLARAFNMWESIVKDRIKGLRIDPF